MIYTIEVCIFEWRDIPLPLQYRSIYIINAIKNITINGRFHVLR